MAVRFNMLSRKAQDRFIKSDLNNDRIRNRKRIVFLNYKLSDEVFFDLANSLKDPEIIRLVLINVLKPAERLIDKLINIAYNNDDLA